MLFASSSEISVLIADDIVRRRIAIISGNKDVMICPVVSVPGKIVKCISFVVLTILPFASPNIPI